MKLEKERLKFETLKQRAEDKNELETVRKENRERDLLILGHSKRNLSQVGMGDLRF